MKDLVREETGIAPEHQRLLYGAKQLEDGKRLCDYPPLGNGASILLVLRLPGGGGLLSRSRDDDYSRSAPPATNDESMRNVDISIRNEDRHISEDAISSSSDDTSLSNSLASSRSTSPDHLRTEEDSSTPQTNDDNTLTTRNIDKSIPRSSEDCMITLTPDNSLLTPCKHSISPDGLMDYCWDEISTNIKHEIKCPLCSTEWSLEMIKRYGGASDTEMTQLELGLARNACKNDPTIRKCPFCDVYCERQNTSANHVRCISCARKPGGGNKVFCWLCLKPWKNDFWAADCGNEDCNVNKRKLERLKESPMTTVTFFPGKKIYKLRACPNCGVLIEHKSGCKQMTCAKCTIEFCFICLRKRVGGSWSCGIYDTPCALAPIQTDIPSK